MTVVIRDSFHQLIEIDPTGTPARTKEKLWFI